MSKLALEKTIRDELKKLNDAIDVKVIRGLSYRREALRHRFLLSRLSDLHRPAKFAAGWLERSLSNIAMMLL
ncbi:MAG: hypothetical protein KGH93_02195 [Patescibacteria group bacterium]|nr:hypothetical protein [Patescibacteria group bacterium]MDE1945988.1 hypothetical protein [Patescibacteria group bacterium]